MPKLFELEIAKAAKSPVTRITHPKSGSVAEIKVLSYDVFDGTFGGVFEISYSNGTLVLPLEKLPEYHAQGLQKFTIADFEKICAKKRLAYDHELTSAKAILVSHPDKSWIYDTTADKIFDLHISYATKQKANFFI